MTETLSEAFKQADKETFFGNISLAKDATAIISNPKSREIVCNRLEDISSRSSRDMISRYDFMRVIADLEATYEHYQRSGKAGNESDMELSRTAMKAYSGAVQVYLKRANADLPLKMPEGTILDKDLKTPAANMQAQRFDR